MKRLCSALLLIFLRKPGFCTGRKRPYRNHDYWQKHGRIYRPCKVLLTHFATVCKPHAPIGLGPVLAHFYASNEDYAIRADGTVMGWGFYTGGGKEWVPIPVPVFKTKLAD